MTQDRVAMSSVVDYSRCGLSGAASSPWSGHDPVSRWPLGG